jgi:hypothetical protein
MSDIGTFMHSLEGTKGLIVGYTGIVYHAAHLLRRARTAKTWATEDLFGRSRWILKRSCHGGLSREGDFLQQPVTDNIRQTGRD